jgi:hypothetical protein
MTMRAGKGDHRHVRNAEEAYRFTDPDTLLADFWREVGEIEAMR